MEEFQKIERTTNNFDFLRLIAALMVLYSHALLLISDPNGNNRYGEPLNILTDGQMNFGNLGVVIFFTISGYLITKSIFSSGGYRAYFTRRLVRIFPALMLDLLVSVFIFGTLATTISLYEYFTDALTWRYLLNICLFKLSFMLPAVFEKNISTNYVNGSLWTLPYEFTLYVGVAGLYFLSILKNRKVYLIFYSACIIVGFYGLNTKFRGISLFFSDVTFIPLFRLAAYFGMGAMYYLFRDKISLKPVIAFCLLVVSGVTSHFYLLDYSGFLCIPYIVFWFVNEQRLPFQNAGRFGDFSYGIYIYGAPVQQMIVHFSGNHVGTFAMVILSFVLTMPLALFSWFAVEKKALKLKGSIDGVGRGWEINEN